MVVSNGQARRTVREGQPKARGPWECQLTQGLLATWPSFPGDPGPGVSKLPWGQMPQNPALWWGRGHKHKRDGPKSNGAVFKVFIFKMLHGICYYAYDPGTLKVGVGV